MYCWSLKGNFRVKTEVTASLLYWNALGRSGARRGGGDDWILSEEVSSLESWDKGNVNLTANEAVQN